MFNQAYENKAVYFRGDKVILTGEMQALHGGVFCAGEYVEGHKNGEPVLVIVEYVDANMIKTSGETE